MRVKIRTNKAKSISKSIRCASFLSTTLLEFEPKCSVPAWKRRNNCQRFAWNSELIKVIKIRVESKIRFVPMKKWNNASSRTKKTRTSTKTEESEKEATEKDHNNSVFITCTAGNEEKISWLEVAHFWAFERFPFGKFWVFNTTTTKHASNSIVNNKPFRWEHKLSVSKPMNYTNLIVCSAMLMFHG